MGEEGKIAKNFLFYNASCIVGFIIGSLKFQITIKNFDPELYVYTVLDAYNNIIIYIIKIEHLNSAFSFIRL